MLRHIPFILLFFFIAFSASAEELKPLTVQLKWQHQFQFAGFYAAVEKGFYRKAGFEVTLKQAAVGVNPIEVVLSGKADYGVANSELLLYHLKGSPVTALAVLIQHSPLVLVSLENSGIYSPQDLIGKRVMFPAGPYGANTLGLLAREGVEASQVKQVPMSFNVDDLVNGQVDAMVGYATDLPYQLNEKGVAFNLIQPRSYGIDFYGDTLFTSRDRVGNKSEEVRLFRNATLAGWRYALEHPQEVIGFLQTRFRSSKDLEALQFEATAMRKLMAPTLVDLGHMNPGRWQHIGETFAALGMGPQKIDLKGFLYDPNRTAFNERMRQLIWWMVIAAALVGLLLLLLVALNWRLNRKVSAHALELAERKHREISLRLLSKAVENSHSGVLIIDSSEKVVYANPAFCEQCGLDAPELQSMNLSDVRRYLALPEIDSRCWEGPAELAVPVEVKGRFADGSERWVQVAVSPILEYPDQGVELYKEPAPVSHYVFSCEDITPQKKSQEQMEKLAFYDQLTGLESRLLFKLRLENALARSARDNKMTALMFIDLDLFKKINDHYGHDVGDEVLKAVATRIRQTVRSNDTVARISGDEFTVIVSDIVDHTVVRRVAEDILNSLTKAINVAGIEHVVSVSIGIAITPSDANDVETLTKHADVAMYQAKKSGRNGVQFFSHSMNEWVKEKKQLEQDMREALSERQFKLVYQPVVELTTGKLVGLEVLLRWQHPVRGSISPEYFIPLAEESGLILPLGKWLAHELIAAMQRISSVGVTGLMMSINMSPKQVRDDALLRDVSQILQRQGADDFRLLLELTERALRDDGRNDGVNLRRLTELGFKLVVDEFGEGGVSVRMLSELPAEYIKISRQFVQECAYNVASQQAICATLALARCLGIQAIAVGVESLDQVRFLREQGCALGQGHLFSPASELEELLDRFSPDNVVMFTSAT
ncbi:MAG: EAL domain-containing protein [Ketobacter sp.]|nr:EAL domain-containing protein [Ketobacter sp.]